jgi:LmbE family N-acetylglucosaminyl deacetylase
LSAVVVSPHFDDSVFSAAHVLAAGGSAVTVLTVCGGAPPGGQVSQWDLECGYPSGTAAARARRDEDLRANELARVRSVHLGFTDEPYRTRFPHDQVAANLAAALPTWGEVWVPAGLGSHPDHTGTREAVLAVVPANSGRVRFYADCPYAFAFGWDASDADRDPDHRWGAHLARIEEYLGRARAHLVLLDRDAMRLKLDMLACHRSQLSAMRPEFPGLDDPDGPLRTEMYWAADPARPGGLTGGPALR